MERPTPAGAESAGVVRIGAWVMLVIGTLGGLGWLVTSRSGVTTWLGIYVLIQTAIVAALGLALAAAAENSAAMRLELWELRQELRQRLAPPESDSSRTEQRVS